MEKDAPLVPEDFTVPQGFRSGLFVLEPLGVRHNESDHAAWTSSADHIKMTPGFDDGNTWLDQDPLPSLADNVRDLLIHEKEFADRTGFAYTVLDPATADVIGCVYIRPPFRHGHKNREGCDADVRSWVRADRADLDKPLSEAVARWLCEAWPFTDPDYVGRLPG